MDIMDVWKYISSHGRSVPVDRIAFGMVVCICCGQLVALLS